MAVATLVLAVVGLVISVISLTWQVVQHSLTGSRVRAELLLGGFGFGGVVTGPFDMDRSVLASQGVIEWFSRFRCGTGAVCPSTWAASRWSSSPVARTTGRAGT